MIIIVSTVLISCNKENQKMTESKDSIIQNPEMKNSVESVTIPPGFTNLSQYRTYLRNIYAKALAQAMTDINVRNFVKLKVNQKTVTETEFLHLVNKNELINGLSFSQILANITGDSLGFFTTHIPFYDPRLSILIPDDYEPENWNTAGLTPLVAAAPDGWEDDLEIFVPIYTTNGTFTQVSSNEQPDILTVVVTETESVEPYVKPFISSGGEFFYEDDNYVFFVVDGNQYEGGVERVGKDNDATKATPGSFLRRACDRDNSGKFDKLYSVAINGKTNLRAMESWLKGKPELICNIVFNEAAPGAAKLFKDHEKTCFGITRKEAKNSTQKVFNITVVKWDNLLVSDYIKYEWKEREGNGGERVDKVTTFTVIVNGITFTLNQPINWNRKDKKVGDQLIGYCDPANGSGSNYNTGAITFNERI